VDRTHYCGELSEKAVDSDVVLYGWVKNTRNLGGCIFLDLRDREGIVQVVFDPADDRSVFEKASGLGREFVIRVTGKVRRRPNPNSKIPTGMVEVVATGVEVISRSEVPPIEVEDIITANEETRFRNRVLDLRRRPVQRIFKIRHKAVQSVRRYLDEQGYMELETPFLARSTPEGARDFLVPSRKQRGSFYALPQSPQLFKQLFMAAGFDRYFQVVKCFRDEDLRGERQPEFTQIDIEASFVEPEDIYELVDGLISRTWRDAIDAEVDLPLPRMTWQEAMDRFGSDKPDLRLNGMEIQDLSDVFKGSGFKVFESVIEDGGVVRGLAAPLAYGWSRKQVQDLEAVVKEHGAAGMAWVKLGDDNVTSGPLARFLNRERAEHIRRLAGIGEKPALVCVCAGKNTVTVPALGALRLELGKRLGLIERDTYRFAWITDFPLFEWSEEEHDWTPSHHPFTRPRIEDLALLDENPGGVRSLAYDIVCNGSEIGGGSIRIHEEDLQRRIFERLGISSREAEEKFGFFLRNLKFGTPPHGGVALGMDRITMILTGADSIREVIPFPKTTTGQCLLTNAPSRVDERQFRELGLELLR